MGTTTDVRAAVENEFGFDPMVDSRDIKVMNIEGDVTIAGTVPSYPQYREAAAAGAACMAWSNRSRTRLAPTIISMRLGMSAART
jgi:BON domain